MSRSFFLCVFCLITGSAVPLVRAETPRLVQVAHLWHQVKFRHPALIDGTVDWDKALAEALPSIEAATSDAELAAALTRLLAPLNDPGVRVLQSPPAPAYVQWGAQGDEVEWLGPHTALLHLHQGTPNVERLAADPAQREQLRVRLQAADALVIDVRPVRGRALPVDRALNGLLADLIARPITLPAEQIRFQSDLDSPHRDNLDSLLSGLYTLAAERLVPSAKSRPVRLAFIVDEYSMAPRAVTGLHSEGRAAVVSAGGQYRNRVYGVDEVTVSGVTIQYSPGNLVGPAGPLALTPDLIVARDAPTGAGSAAVVAAVQLLAAPPAVPPTAGRAVLPIPVLLDETRHKEMPLPDYGWRVLAAIRLWSTMETYFPYLSLTDTPWEDALGACLQEMKQVDSPQTYAVALAHMAAKLDDSHVRLFSRGMYAYLGEATLGLTLRMVEGKVAIAALPDASLAASGLKVGDELVAIDGEPVGARLARLMPVLSGSTRAAKLRDAAHLLLNGVVGSRIQLDLVRAGRGKFSAAAARKAVTADPARPLRAHLPVFQTLPGNIGYVDLDRLELDQVDAMFDALMGTRALIFDMRGYPHQTAWQIAPRINVRRAQTGALFSHPLFTPNPGARALALTFAQPLPLSERPLYKGKIVMLINEDTQSQAEHTGLFFEAAAPLTLIGTASAGANGDVRRIALPGNVEVYFSGYEVRHADGRQLQRIGLQPDIVVAPTLRGLRNGEDEVLQRALRFLRRRPALIRNARPGRHSASAMPSNRDGKHGQRG